MKITPYKKLWLIVNTSVGNSQSIARNVNDPDQDNIFHLGNLNGRKEKNLLRFGVGGVYC